MTLVRRIAWVDVNGNSRTTQAFTSASLVAVETALLAASNADWLTELETVLNVNTAPAPIAGQFQTVLDSASLWFQTPAGNIVTLTLPAPKSSIFLADLQTVNPASVAGIVSAALAAPLTDQSGTAVTVFLGGTRQPTVTGV